VDRPDVSPGTRSPGGASPAWVVALIGAALLASGCERTETRQQGPRGTGMVLLDKPSAAAANADVHAIPPPEPVDPPDPAAPALKDEFVNIKALDDLTVLEFSRLMQAFSTWLAPEEGCDFCHNPDKLEEDVKYPKLVARRMVEMTRRINTEWKSHVGETGVTCWTCHRGQAVPSGDWFANPGPHVAGSTLGNKAGQNTRGVDANGNTSLPFDALSEFLAGDPKSIRIQGTRPLAGENRHSIKQAEYTYSLMIYLSRSLGVNCNFCHNTRALARWDQSSPQRVQAWYGIRMVRFINQSYLTPIKDLLPAHRLSPEGDGPKVGCATCHKGINKPLRGVSMLADYPELARKPVRITAEATPPSGPATPEPAAPETRTTATLARKSP
jgi:photosynthetic reaction center cytochrome c subunit